MGYVTNQINRKTLPKHGRRLSLVAFLHTHT